MKTEESKQKNKQYEHILLRRSRLPPLRFYGRTLGEGSNYQPNGERSRRWDTYTLYETKAGKYVLYHEYHTLWDREDSYNEASVADSAKEAILAGYEYEDEDDQMEKKIIPEVLIELATKLDIDITEYID